MSPKKRRKAIVVSLCLRNSVKIYRGISNNPC
jgi:hypothetical protein